MLIINKDNIEKYRFAVGKVSFFQSYEEYYLVENMPGNNGMIVSNDNGIKYAFFMFQKPSGKCDYPVIVWQEKMNGTSKKEEYEYRILSSRFSDIYSQNIIQSLVSAQWFYNNLKEDYKLFFKDLLVDINCIQPLDGYLYKHYSDKTIETVGSANHQINDGFVSFVNPDTFNDPFDCNCLFSNGNSMSDYFRIFCTGKKNDNILTWSYYSSEHRGYCFKYSKRNIVNAVVGFDGLLIIGNVDYKIRRPATRTPSNRISWSNIRFYIEASFTKYKEWNHEDEYRFVLLSESFHKNSVGNYLNYYVGFEDIYRGCKNSGADIKKSDGSSLSTKRMKKDDNEYKLIEEGIIESIIE